MAASFSWRAGCGLLLCVSFGVLPGCDGGGESGVVRRDGQPDYVRVEDEGEMDRAIAKARATAPEFIAALKAAAPGQSGYAVKKAFPTPDGGGEHIWMNGVSWDGSVFRGTINNEPVDTDAVKMGDTAEITPEELSDWMYVENGTLVGGYTVRVLHYGSTPEEQQAFTEATGLTVPPVDF